MPKGGVLMLSTLERDGYAEISVSDTGSGMSPEVRARIFDPFFTTKGKAGMGLGLAVSFGIISRHQGNIEVESAVSCGTTFRIKIPLAPVEAKAHTRDMEALTPPPLQTLPSAPLMQQNHLRVLVVDDEVDVRELLRDILESKGYNVTLAEGGREALSLFDANNFDGVFTDIGMPGMNGWELARAIRERNQHIPLAVITGWGDAVGADDQKIAQVDWVVTKPFSADRILELAQEVSKRQESFEGATLPIAASREEAFLSV
jgi:CheY-like chemotaxis protein